MEPEPTDVPAGASENEPDAANDSDSNDTDSNDTDDLDNFSWKLSRNDQLDPLIHRDAESADKDTAATAAAAADASDEKWGDGATSVLPVVDADSDVDLPTRRQARQEAEQDAPAPAPVIIPGRSDSDAPGPRRQTYTGPATEPASPGTLGLPAGPARRPLRSARPARVAGPARAGARAPRPVVLGAIAVVALIVLGGLFFLGSQLPSLLAGPAATPTPSATPTPVATPEPTTPAAPVGPAALGEQKWTALAGGECLDPYSTPWAETFTVVDCGAAHAAQMIATGLVNEDPAAAYPGEEAILQQIYLWCSAPGVLDGAAASDYSDLQVQGTYPVSEEQWADGQRNYYCFVNRSSGEPLTGSVAAPQG